MSAWQPIETAPRDGTEILILTKTGAVSAYFCPGEWHDHHEYGPQYDGAIWCCYDDKFQIEVEETPEGDFSEAKFWMPLEPSPLDETGDA